MGKTTVSQKLATELNAQYIGITELVKAKNLIMGIDKERATLISDTEKVSKHINAILTNTECTLIIDGHYAIDTVPCEQVDTVFVLRRDPRELKKILEKRAYSEKKIWENLAAEILDVCLFDALSACDKNKVCEINCTNKTIEAIVEDIILIVRKKKRCSFGNVDWLGKLEDEGQLEFLNNI